MKFKDYLQTKTLFYRKISRFNMFALYEKYKEFFTQTTNIQIIGTNGKGSTGRFLALLLKQANYRVGHYTSPHIFDFNERFWLDGKLVNDENLEKAHLKLAEILKDDLLKLSYFEYATFLAMVLFKDCDFVVLEAGVGGEYDATSVFKRDFSIFTNIGFDHQELLGNDIKDIARTKLKAMCKRAIISYNQDFEVIELAKHIAKLKNSTLKISAKKLEKTTENALDAYAAKFHLASFLKDNLRLAYEAFGLILKQDNLCKYIEKLPKLDLRARCEQIASNIFIDVGHNEMAALALAEIFKEKKVHLVYNCFWDKDSYNILKALKPIIKVIEIYHYQSEQRELAGEKLIENINHLGIKYCFFEKIQKEELYLVFGSFMLVEKFLRGYRER